MEMQAFDDVGDKSAPPGSRPWCAAMRLHAKSELNNTQSRVGNLKYTLKNIKEGNHYRTLQDRDGNDFETWEDFVQAPWPYGLDFNPDVANAVLAEKDTTKLIKLVASEVMASAAPASKHGGSRKAKQGSDATLHGRGVEYLAARIRRDRPDIAAAVERGEYRSIREAAIAAGIIKIKTPLYALHAAWRKASEQERQDFLKFCQKTETLPESDEAGFRKKTFTIPADVNGAAKALRRRFGSRREWRALMERLQWVRLERKGDGTRHGGVVVDSGPISESDKPRDVPQEKWGLLMDARRYALQIDLNYGFRRLMEYIDDAEIMHKPLGFDSAEDMIRRGYELSPEQVAIAVEWLRINQAE